MKYLGKTADSTVIQEGWTYAKQGDRPKIRSELLNEQSGFCAYTERYVTPVDAVEIEHFDDRLKGTSDDDYWNWYAVHRWINLKKPKIDALLPILSPYDESVQNRIQYKGGIFVTVEENDQEAKNLITLLGVNDPSLVEYRAKSLARVKSYRDLFETESEFVEFLTSDPENLSFISMLEAELELNLST